MQQRKDNHNEDNQRFYLDTENGSQKLAVFQYVDGVYLHIVTLEGCTQNLGEWIVESMNELRRSEQRFLVRHAISSALDKCDDELRVKRTELQVRIATRVMRHLQQVASQPQFADDAHWQQILIILRTYFEKYPGL